MKNWKKLRMVSVLSQEQEGMIYTAEKVSSYTTGAVAVTAATLTVVTTISSLLGKTSAAKPLIWTIAFLLQNMSYLSMIDACYPGNVKVFIKMFIMTSMPFYDKLNIAIMDLFHSLPESDPFFSDQSDSQGLKARALSERNFRALEFKREIPFVYTEFGIEKGLIQNAYIYFAFLIIQIFTYFLCKLIYCLCCRGKKIVTGKKALENMVKGFEFGTFLNGFRTEVTELLIYSIVNILYGWESYPFYTIQLACSFLTLVLLVIFMGWVLVIMRNDKKRESPRLVALFEEFKTDKKVRKYFHAFEFGKGILLGIA